ncbi:MAG: hypothetical protein ACI4TB_04400, partial [Lachnospiraceae bacterium]
MVRFYWLIITTLPLIIFYIVKATHYAKHPEQYDEETCFKLAVKLIDIIKKRGKITTQVFGVEALPKDGG